MAESSLPWAGTTVGDAGPYTDDAWSDMYSKLFQSDRTLQGPIFGLLGQLAVTNPAGTTFRIASGYAIVDGKVYTNTANVDLAGAVPASGSNFYTIVLRKNFTAQTVRLALLGPDVSAPPAVTQTDGTTWEIAIATAEITDAAAVTITDVRSFCKFNTQMNASSIDNRLRTYHVMPDFTSIYTTPTSTTPAARSHNPAFGWITDSTYATVFLGITTVPEDYVSGFKVESIWANQAIGPNQVVIDGELDAGSMLDADPWESEDMPSTVHNFVASEAKYIPFATLSSVGKGDIVSFRSARRAEDPNDIFNSAGFFTFWGWRISYTADM